MISACIAKKYCEGTSFFSFRAWIRASQTSISNSPSYPSAKSPVKGLKKNGFSIFSSSFSLSTDRTPFRDMVRKNALPPSDLRCSARATALFVITRRRSLSTYTSRETSPIGRMPAVSASGMRLGSRTRAQRASAALSAISRRCSVVRRRARSWPPLLWGLSFMTNHPCLLRALYTMLATLQQASPVRAVDNACWLRLSNQWGERSVEIGLT